MYLCKYNKISALDEVNGRIEKKLFVICPQLSENLGYNTRKE
jgi:hypothetical protein